MRKSITMIAANQKKESEDSKSAITYFDIYLFLKMEFHCQSTGDTLKQEEYLLL